MKYIKTLMDTECVKIISAYFLSGMNLEFPLKFGDENLLTHSQTFSTTLLILLLNTSLIDYQLKFSRS